MSGDVLTPCIDTDMMSIHAHLRERTPRMDPWTLAIWLVVASSIVSVLAGIVELAWHRGEVE
ncbi:hypothetical protein GCM10027053_51460 [Intrasporangium mesophilum]